MKNYLKPEVCRPWQNTVYTLIMHPGTERKRRDGYDRWGWALCSPQPIANEYLLQSLRTLPAVSISEAYSIQSRREVDIIWASPSLCR